MNSLFVKPKQPVTEEIFWQKFRELPVTKSFRGFELRNIMDLQFEDDYNFNPFIYPLNSDFSELIEKAKNSCLLESGININYLDSLSDLKDIEWMLAHILNSLEGYSNDAAYEYICTMSIEELVERFSEYLPKMLDDMETILKAYQDYLIKNWSELYSDNSLYISLYGINSSLYFDDWNEIAKALEV